MSDRGWKLVILAIFAVGNLIHGILGAQRNEGWRAFLCGTLSGVLAILILWDLKHPVTTSAIAGGS